MEEKRYIVYVHIFPNNKKYFGITSKKPNARWENGFGYSEKGQPVMYNAIQKYGWENIEHKILHTNLTFEEANQKEIELIAKYKTNCRKYGDDYGYNMTDGGDGTKGHFVSEDQRKKMSERMTGRTKGLCPNSVPVICDGIEYCSIGDFKEKNNITKGDVISWLMGRKGMPVEWYEKGLRYKDKNEYEPFCREKPWQNVVIYDGKEYYSQAELAKVLNISPATLCYYLSGKKSTPKSIYDKGLYRKDGKSNVRCSNKREINIYYDGKNFTSLKTLSEYMGVKKGTLWAWVNGKNSIPKKYKEKGLEVYK